MLLNDQSVFSYNRNSLVIIFLIVILNETRMNPTAINETLLQISDMCKLTKKSMKTRLLTDCIQLGIM